jgi:hypothetical protein
MKINCYDMKKIIFFLLLSFLLFGCHTYDPIDRRDRVCIHNYTDSAIYITYSCFDSMPKEPRLYLFEKIENNCYNENGNSLAGNLYSPSYRINAYSYEYPFNILYADKMSFNKCLDKKIRFFIVTEKTMKENTWEYIHEKQLYEKKLVFTEEELK